jgi:hypothetical protein
MLVNTALGRPSAVGKPIKIRERWPRNQNIPESFSIRSR